MLQDIRHAFRFLARSPTYSLVTLLTLAIGLGATTTVFSIVNGLLLRPLPYQDPEQLFTVWVTNGPGQTGLSWRQFTSLKEDGKSFQNLGLYSDTFVDIDYEGKLARRKVARVSSGFIDALRVQPVLGRGFSVDDERAEAPSVALIDYGFWWSHFGGDARAVGRQVRLSDHRPVTVIGVLPQEFRSPFRGESPSIWTLEIESLQTNLAAPFKRTLGRLARGVTGEQAGAEVSLLHDTALEGRFSLTPLLDHLVRGHRTQVLLFLGAVLCVLLIVIINLTSLELARFPMFEDEVSIRTALGAPAWRLMRLVVVRSLILGIGGGTLGIAFAVATLDSLIASMPNLPRTEAIQLDGRVWVFALSMSMVSSILVAILPALKACRRKRPHALHTTAVAYTETRQHRVYQDLLIVFETAVALVLAVSAGLLIKSLWHLTAIDLGFEPQGVTVARISFPDPYLEAQQQVFVENVLNRFHAIPGTEIVAFSDTLPLASIRRAHFWRPSNDQTIVPATIVAVSPGYFDVLQIPLREGRRFFSTEQESPAREVVISESVARSLWPDRPPVGEALLTGVSEDPFELTVVGVTSDIGSGGPMQGLDHTVFVPLTVWLQEIGNSSGRLWLIAQTSMSSEDLMATIKESDQRVGAEIQQMQDLYNGRIARPRFRAILFGVLATFSCLLAAIGIYSILTYAVARRTREIGVCLALGVKPIQLFGQVLGPIMMRVVLGVALGLLGSMAVQQLLGSYLFGIQPNDMSTYLTVTLSALALFFVACAIPAQRAIRLDPASALRSE